VEPRALYSCGEAAALGYGVIKDQSLAQGAQHAGNGALLCNTFRDPLLAEWPSETDWASIILISAGAYPASGAPLPSRTRRQSRPSAI
jgi:hypothetical protein